MRGDDAEHGIAHLRQQIVVGDVARSDHLDAGLVEAAFGELLHEGGALAGRHEHEDRIRLGVGRALQERREVRVGERDLDGFGNRAAAGGERRGERLLGIGARRVVGHHGHDLLHVILQRVVGDDGRGLRQREAGARDVGRALGDHRSAGGHHQFDHLGFGRQRGDDHGGGRDFEAGQHADLVVDDQFLRQALAVVRHARGVAQDDLNLFTGDGVAVFLHVEVDGGLDLLAGRGLLAGHGDDEADLDGLLRLRCAQAHRSGEQARRGNLEIVHSKPSRLTFIGGDIAPIFPQRKAFSSALRQLV